MTQTIDFYFDIVSPYSYLAHAKLPALAEQYGAEIHYHPIDVQKAKLAVGNNGPSTREMPIKRRYIQADLRRWAAKYELPFSLPENFDSQRLNVLAFYANDRNCTREYLDAAWQRVWGEGRAMNDEGLLIDIVRAMGWNREEVLAFLQSGDGDKRLLASNEMALSQGVFGVPTMIVNDQMWWGNDRLALLETYLKGE